MTIDHPHALAPEEARRRLEILGTYLVKKHGLAVAWSGNRARVSGSVLAIGIDATLSLDAGNVRLDGTDPGFLWRKKVEEFLRRQLSLYLDPATPESALPRI